MSERIRGAITPSLGIKGRKYTPDESNDGQAMLAVIGKGV
jgi:hypothetical protein